DRGGRGRRHRRGGLRAGTGRGRCRRRGARPRAGPGRSPRDAGAGRASRRPRGVLPDRPRRALHRRRGRLGRARAGPPVDRHLPRRHRGRPGDDQERTGALRGGRRTALARGRPAGRPARGALDRCGGRRSRPHRRRPGVRRRRPGHARSPGRAAARPVPHGGAGRRGRSRVGTGPGRGGGLAGPGLGRRLRRLLRGRQPGPRLDRRRRPTSWRRGRGARRALHLAVRRRPPGRPAGRHSRARRRHAGRARHRRGAGLDVRAALVVRATGRGARGALPLGTCARRAVRGRLGLAQGRDRLPVGPGAGRAGGLRPQRLL
ncbi:MAG: Renalase, oxidases 1,2-dihydro- and 1,6-dihydro-beta-NAD(P)H isomers back to NAD(P), partial [uncultured Frankineae bacterium]